MLIVGERLNTSRPAIHEAVVARDPVALQREAARQIDAGAHYLDVNCGSLSAEEEPEALAWLVEVVQALDGAPLCLDSANPAALRAALAVHQGRPLINSISGESERYRQVLPLVREYDASVVVLGLDDNGIPREPQQALPVSVLLIERLLADGLELEHLYFDPLVRSLAVTPDAVGQTLELMVSLSQRFPGLHLISGLSNVSYGLPERRHINRAFLVLSVASGLDAVIVDPLDRTLVALTYAAEALTGKDRYNLRYIQAFKEGRLSA